MAKQRIKLQRLADDSVPPFDSDEWKAFVADAIAKRPAKRTAAERRAIADAMELLQSERDAKA